MAQTPVTFRIPGDALPYTPNADVPAGTVVLIGNKVTITKEKLFANVQGDVHVKGVFNFPKDASVFAAGDPVFWNPTGNPVGGTAGSGAATSTPTAYFAGYVVPDGAALTGDETVDVKLAASELSATSGVAATIPTATVAATGSAQGDAAAVATGFTLVTAADGTKGVILPAASAGKKVEIKNGANAVLKIYPATGDAINAIAANGALSIAALTSVILTAYDATTWYSTPLLPS